jgi:PKD repeat protein
VRSTYASPTTGDPAFIQYLSKQSGTTTDIGGVLAQYMDTTRHNSHNRFTLQKTVQISPSVAPAPGGKVLDAQIQTVLRNQIGSGALPAPAGNGLATIYVLLFPPNDNVCFDSSNCAYGNNGGFCAYHGSFKLNTSTQVLYAPIVDNGPGTPNFGGCGPGASDLGNQTAVVSHEMSETINDPLNSVASWYDYKANGEIADKCDAQPPAHNGPWTVESLWSNRDGRCEAGEPVFHSPTASFLADSTATAGQPVSFSAATSTDPSGNTDSALDQASGVSYKISSGIVAYAWNWGDGSTPTLSIAAGASHTFAQSGNYQVSLTVTDALGFTSTKTQAISVSGTSGAPVLGTAAASAVSDQGATLNGAINPEGQTVTYHFAYGTDPGSLSQSTSETQGPSGQTSQPVSAQISGLSAATKYYYELVVTAGANTYDGTPSKSFTTTTSSPPPTAPVVTTGAAQTISSGGARLTGGINPEGLTVSYYFRYGKTSLSNTTPVTHGLTGHSAAPVSASITGLSAGTNYHYELVATASSTRYDGAERSFTTALPLSNVITGPASNVTSNSASVSGMVDPRGTNTIYQAQYGTSKRYGHSTTWITGGSKNAYEHVDVALFGLQPGTTYHYRLVAQNKHGTTVGADRTFTTTAAKNSAPRFYLRVAPRMRWGRLLAGQLRARLGCSGPCVAHILLVAEPAGTDRAPELPMTLARGQATLHARGSTTTAVRFPSRFQNRLRRASRRPSEVLVMGYATADGALASAPVQAVIRLTG